MDYLDLMKCPKDLVLPYLILLIIVVINSFNLIDGVDGLAGTLLVCYDHASFWQPISSLVNNARPYSLLAFAMAGSLCCILDL